MICRQHINATDVAVTRPTRSGAGGDTSGSTPLYTDLEAIFDPDEGFVRTPGRREEPYSARMFFNVKTSAGAALDLQEGDEFTWTDSLSVSIGPYTAVKVNRHVKGVPTDHIEVLVNG